MSIQILFAKSIGSLQTELDLVTFCLVRDSASRCMLGQYINNDNILMVIGYFYNILLDPLVTINMLYNEYDYLKWYFNPLWS